MIKLAITFLALSLSLTGCASSQQPVETNRQRIEASTSLMYGAYLASLDTEEEKVNLAKEIGEISQAVRQYVNNTDSLDLASVKQFAYSQVDGDDKALSYALIDSVALLISDFVAQEAKIDVVTTEEQKEYVLAVLDSMSRMSQIYVEVE